MKKIFVFVLLFFMLPVQAKHLYKESVYQDFWCSEHNGTQEYKLLDKSRVDCYLPDMAVEFDFANKRDECLGQALRYAAYTQKTPACVLILEKKKDLKYYEQLRYTIQELKLDVKLFFVTPEDLVKKITPP